MDLTVIKRNGQYVIDSREVAEMVGKRHADLLESIDNYVTHLLNGNFRSVDFFIPNNYQDTTGRTLRSYLLTRKGCDMVANKMTGEKGVLFTAVYVTKFEEMEKAQKPLSQIEILLQSVQLLAEQERKLKIISDQQAVINHRIDSLDSVNIHGDKRQRLNAMVRKYARQEGIDYRKAWNEFIKAYNTAFRVNLNAQKHNHEKRSGKEVTTPEFLDLYGHLDDAIRVADKMLNQEGAGV